jgi:hypothetical protein
MPVDGWFYSNDPVGAATFLSKGNVHGFNRYTYANNNPYLYTDPDGEAAQLALCAGGPIGCLIGVGLLTYAVYHGVSGTQEALESRSQGFSLGSEGRNNPVTDFSANSTSPGGDPGDDDNYENPGHHDPSGGPNNYNREYK